MKKNNVICYEPWKLNKHENKYSMHDIELCSIVHTLRMWRSYLMDNRFELRSYYHNLKYLFEQLNLNAHCWMEFLSEFSFEIKHMNGKKNQVVDTLSRINQLMKITAISIWKKHLKIKFLEALSSYED